MNKVDPRIRYVKLPNEMVRNLKKFHEHLDVCDQCKRTLEQNLCQTGESLLNELAFGKNSFLPLLWQTFNLPSITNDP